MSSVLPALVLSVVLQAGPAAPAAPAWFDAPIATQAPAAGADPIGDLMSGQTQAPDPAPAPPAPVAPAPSAVVTAPAAQAPVAQAPVAQAPVAQAPAPLPAPPAVAVAPAPRPTVQAAPAPAPTASADDEDDDEDVADLPQGPQPYRPSEQASLPAGPQPYNSLAPTPPPAPSRMFTQPLVRLPPRPQGTLDGGWLLARSDGSQLYSFQFNDLGGGQEVEGAWRDLRREWAQLGSGPVSSVGYDAGAVTIRFLETGKSQMSVVSLRPSGGGEWAGELTGDGRPTQVVMRRN